jgi:hypothetical protein
VLLVATLALAGCVPTPTPTPTPGASPPAAACDAVFTPDAYAKLSNDGLEPLEPPAVDHMATFYPLAAQMVEASGLSCH